MFEKEILTIDIGTQNIKFIIGMYKKNKVIVKKMMSMKTPVNTFIDGDIIDLLVLTDKIKELFKEEKINVKDVICTSSSTAIITREVIIPAVGEKDLDTIIKFEVAQYLPIDMERYVLNHKIVEKFMDGEVEKYKIQAVAYPKNKIEKYLKLAQGLKLNPMAMDVDSNCMYKLFREPIQINEEEYILDKSFAIVDMGASALRVTIIAKGMDVFNRSIKSGGAMIDGYIERELHVSSEEAEKKKKEEFNFNIDASNLLNLGIKSVVDNWIQEMDRIFQYYKNSNKENKLDGLYIIGGSSNLIGIEDYMSIRFGMPVLKIKALSNVEFNKTTNETEINQYLNAIGALIRL